MKGHDHSTSGVAGSAMGTEAGSGEEEMLWRSLEELAEGSQLSDFLAGEFPHWAEWWNESVDRRTVLKLMAASLAMAGLGGCGRPAEEIVPYVRAPEGLLPGIPQHYATAVTLGGFARGVVATSHMGRPIKIEGNDKHPSSQGATDIYAQAAVLGLYDPDRSHAVRNGGQISAWPAFATDLEQERQALAARNGAGLYLLTETVTSPTLGSQIADLLQIFPEARWHQFDPVSRDSVREGAHLAFDVPTDTHYRFDRADVIVSLDSDFLGSQPGHLRYARDFAHRRRARKSTDGINRLYAFESCPGVTGAAADHRWPLRAVQIEAVARAMAHRLGINVSLPVGLEPISEAHLAAVIADTVQHPGASPIVPGDHQTPVVHALAHAMNERLGNVGSTVIHTDPVEIAPTPQMKSLQQLIESMNAGKVSMLLILGGNPVYDAPADLEFEAALCHVPLRIHWGLHANETAALCHWHVPALHELESWSDARGHDGTVSLLQPLIAPLSGGRSAHELLALLLSQAGRSDYEIVRDYWRRQNPNADFEAFWRQALQDGVIPNSALPAQPRKVRADLAVALPPPSVAAQDTLELQFRPDPTLWDGRYANNGWLQELPKPLTQLTWGNAALIGPRMAERLHLENGQVIELTYQGRRLETPVWILPGLADGTLTLYLGHGRSRAGTVGNHVGVNAYTLRTSTAPWFGSGLSIHRPASSTPWGLFASRNIVPLATTQHHHAMQGHDLVKIVTRRQLIAGAAGFEHERTAESPHAPTPNPAHAWGMVIDLNACIGCNACVVACQAENNIPVVGKKEILRGREMHWLRVDRYYQGDPDQPQVLFQPVPCMQCENAPCEPVCPVHASVHDAEGINNQVYNRCVGTRFCQSNCPYKVRRFNFFDYSQARSTQEGTPIMAARRNPEVTVRSRGVMEKCTYCIQRISAARIAADKEGRLIRDGEVVTACQAACPTQAIAFGNINDPDSQVASLREEPHHYVLLAELNTRPRTTYLAKVLNRNPEASDG